MPQVSIARRRSVSSCVLTPGPGPVSEQRCDLFDDPAGEVECLVQAAPVEHEPLTAIAARVSSREWSHDHAEPPSTS